MSLAKAGHDVDLVVADGMGNEKKNGVQIIDAGLKPKSRIKRMVLTGARVYKAARQADADVYHFHDPELLAVGWLLQRKGKKPETKDFFQESKEAICSPALPCPYKFCVPLSLNFSSNIISQILFLSASTKTFQPVSTSSIHAVSGMRTAA